MSFPRICISSMLIISSFIGQSQGLSGAKWDDCNDESRSASDPCYLGCFKDQKNDRALPYQLIRKKANLDRCYEVCTTSTTNSTHGYKYFSRQWKGQCWCDYENSTYDKHGNSTDCNCEAENVGSKVACIYELPALINVSSVSPSAAPIAVPIAAPSVAPIAAPSVAPSATTNDQRNSENVAKQPYFKTEVIILSFILILLLILILGQIFRYCRESPSENTDTDNDNNSDKGSDDENNDNKWDINFDTVISVTQADSCENEKVLVKDSIIKEVGGVSQADSCENKKAITSPVTVIDTYENFQTKVAMIPPCRTISLSEISTKLFVNDDIIKEVVIPEDVEEAGTTNEDTTTTDAGRNKCISCREALPCYCFVPCGHEVCKDCKEKNFPHSSHHEYSVSPIRYRYKNRGPRINRIGSYACPLCQTRVSRILEIK